MHEITYLEECRIGNFQNKNAKKDTHAKLIVYGLICKLVQKLVVCTIFHILEPSRTLKNRKTKKSFEESDRVGGSSKICVGYIF